VADDLGSQKPPSPPIAGDADAHLLGAWAEDFVAPGLKFDGERIEPPALCLDVAQPRAGDYNVESFHNLGAQRSSILGLPGNGVPATNPPLLVGGRSQRQAHTPVKEPVLGLDAAAGRLDAGHVRLHRPRDPDGAAHTRRPDRRSCQLRRRSDTHDDRYQISGSLETLGAPNNQPRVAPFHGRDCHVGRRLDTMPLQFVRTLSRDSTTVTERPPWASASAISTPM
jgi:hypothetical protein